MRGQSVCVRGEKNELKILNYFLKFKMENGKGKIIVSKSGRVKVPVYENFERINTTYNAAGIWKQLSPMRLGPFNLIEPLAETTRTKYEINADNKIVSTIIREQPIRNWYPDGILPGFQPHGDGQIAICETLEGYWQHCGKIYEQERKNGVVYKSFYERRAKGLTISLENAKATELRRVFPKQKSGVPVLSYYQGTFMDWISSRILIYCPWYAKLVVETEAFQKLKEMVDSGVNLQLTDPDGPSAEDDYGVLDRDKLTAALYSTERPFGHAMVLAGLLLEERVWEL